MSRGRGTEHLWATRGSPLRDGLARAREGEEEGGVRVYVPGGQMAFWPPQVLGPVEVLVLHPAPGSTGH